MGNYYLQKALRSMWTKVRETVRSQSVLAYAVGGVCMRTVREREKERKKEKDSR